MFSESLTIMKKLELIDCREIEACGTVVSNNIAKILTGKKKHY